MKTNRFCVQHKAGFLCSTPLCKNSIRKASERPLYQPVFTFIFASFFNLDKIINKRPIDRTVYKPEKMIFGYHVSHAEHLDLASFLISVLRHQKCLSLCLQSEASSFRGRCYTFFILVIITKYISKNATESKTHGERGKKWYNISCEHVLNMI